jgi:hypothetical protein
VKEYYCTPKASETIVRLSSFSIGVGESVLELKALPFVTNLFHIHTLTEDSTRTTFESSHSLTISDYHYLLLHFNSYVSDPQVNHLADGEFVTFNQNSDLLPCDGRDN